MSLKTRQAGVIALAAMLIFTFAAADGSGALAQDFLTGANPAPGAAVAGPPEELGSTARFVSHAVVQPLPGGLADDDETAISVEDADSLEQLVQDMPTGRNLSKDMRCLADAIYFEARGEPLLGQLAVGRVVVNRAESSRFPSSYCGVVYQPGQFSFVRGGHMPRVNKSSPAWRKAKAIARIAHEGLWDSPAKDALFFHTSSVRPGWGLTRVAQVDHHVFYR